jgi:ribose-phosphate pyrophosphokinase
MTPNSELRVFSGSSHEKLTKEIIKFLGIKPGEIKKSKFSGGETYARILENVRGQSAVVVQTCTENVNEDLMELFVIVDALKRASAKSITAVLPHFGYARQDKKSASREPISARLIANLLTTSGVERVITMDMHSDQIQGFFDIPLDNLTAMPLLANYIKSKKLKDVVVVAPDLGRAKTAKKLGDRIGAKLAVIHKTRPEQQKTDVLHVVGKVKGKTVVIVDDMIDTAGTATRGVETLRSLGCNPDIYFIATHGILSDAAIDKVKAAKFKELVVTDTVPLSKEKQLPEIKVLSTADLFGEAINRNYKNKSISSLFD